jgi:hypothetical protein
MRLEKRQLARLAYPGKVRLRVGITLKTVTLPISVFMPMRKDATITARKN